MGVIPVVKLGEPLTYWPWEHIPCSMIAVRLQDLLRDNGGKFNRIFHSVTRAGGVREYLGCPRGVQVILSSVMRDRLIAGSTLGTHIEAVNGLKPDYYMTPDGETYEGELRRGAAEIERMLRWTGQLLKKCREGTPLGLVKGSNRHQVAGHADALAGMGVGGMVFHTGDFLQRSSASETRRARQYVNLIKQRGYHLLLYGIGPSDFAKFASADGFITQSHYVGAFYGQEYNNNGKCIHHAQGGKSLIMRNLARIDLKARRIKNCNGGIEQWVEDSEGTASPMRQDTPRMAAAVPHTGQ